MSKKALTIILGGVIVIAFVIFMIPNKTIGKRYNIEITYVVFYPNHTDTVTASYVGKNGYYLGSDRGTNFIKQESISSPNTEYKNSAPYKVLSQTKTLIEN